MPAFGDLDGPNGWLRLRCEELAERAHREQSTRTIAELFEDEGTRLRPDLHPLGRAFDGYVEKTVRVRSTCFAQYASNRYNMPSRFTGQHVFLRTHAGRIVQVVGPECHCRAVSQ